MLISLSSPSDARNLSAFYQKNKQHLQLWEPLRTHNYHSESQWHTRLLALEENQSIGDAMLFVASQNNKVIATFALTNIVRGYFQACNMGFNVDVSFQGQGFMSRLCLHAIDYAFSSLGLHRIMANYMPDNERCARLLDRLGFSKEGLAKQYLEINGKWQDHVLSALLNPHSQ